MKGACAPQTSRHKGPETAKLVPRAGWGGVAGTRGTGGHRKAVQGRDRLSDFSGGLARNERPSPEPPDASSCTHPDASDAWGPWGPIFSFQPLLALLAMFTIGPWVTFVPLGVGRGEREHQKPGHQKVYSSDHLKTEDRKADQRASELPSMPSAPEPASPELSPGGPLLVLIQMRKLRQS